MDGLLEALILIEEKRRRWKGDAEREDLALYTVGNWYLFISLSVAASVAVFYCCTFSV